MFIKILDIKFHGNPTNSCRADACGGRETDGRTDGHDRDIMGAFHDYAKALNSVANVFSLQWIRNVFCDVGAGYLNII